MCGIAGIFSFADKAPIVSHAELRAIRDAMQRRGPDAAGEWHSPDGRVGLGHRRLSIIDLSDRSTQPMLSSNGRLVISFNGEIYNYRELRSELERDGAVFRTTSDTEVIVELYRTCGQDAVKRLRGMFAFAIWDQERRGVFMARDPYGIKPLYYSLRGGTLRFASQVRALLAGGAVSHSLDPAGEAGFFMWGSVPEPFTFYRDITALRAGHSLWVDEAGARPPRQFFSVAEQWASAAESAASAPSSERAAIIADALRDSVAHHLIADVPVGIFLSGGVDSGAVAGLMRERLEANVLGTTLRFAEFNGSADDEVPLAQETARLYGIEHHVRTVTESEFEADLPRILAAMDQPTIDGLNTWFVSKASAELGLKVALSGLGGDELFGGYASFEDIPKIVRVGQLASGVPGVGRAVRALVAPVLGRTRLHPKIAGALEYARDFDHAYYLKRGLFLPWELADVLPKDVVEEGLSRLTDADAQRRTSTSNPFAAVATLEAERYMRNQLLRDTDWASMAHSLEVRVPLVDSVLLQAVASAIVGGGLGGGKSVLARAPIIPLPESVTGRAKTGFTTPVRTWLQHSQELGAWRRVESLKRQQCPWARRFAYGIADVFRQFR